MWEVVTEYKCLCAEGPVWDSKNSCIYWIDILSGDIHRYSVVSATLVTYNTGEKIGAISLRNNTGLIAALKTGIYEIDFEKKQKRLIADPEEEIPGNRFNDGKCDARGRFWAGTMDDGNGIAKAGTLYVLDENKKISPVIADLTISNGLAWSIDNKNFYHIDTPTRKVTAFDFDLDTGTIGNKVDVINIPDSSGAPDGMTIDAEGMLWIAHWDGWKISRWNPQNGKLLCEIKLPVSRVTSCTFGGHSWTDIYITSAKAGLSIEALEEQPLAGSLFVIRDSGFKGIETSRFRG